MAVGWILGSGALIGQSVGWPFLLLATVGAFLVYRIDRLIIVSPEDRFNRPLRVAFTGRFRWGLLVMAGVGVMAGFLAAVRLQVLWLEIAAGIGLLGMLYPLRILPGGRRPKDIPVLKSLLIAGCWVGGGVVLPAILVFDFATLLPPGTDAPVQSLAKPALLGGYRVVYILPNLLMADWLDREGDAITGVVGIGGRMTPASLRVFIQVNIVVGISLAVWLGMSSILWLVLLDVAGLIGLSVHAWRALEEERGQVSLMDLWAAFPIVTWAAWVVFA